VRTLSEDLKAGKEKERRLLELLAQQDLVLKENRSEGDFSLWDFVDTEGNYYELKSCSVNSIRQLHKTGLMIGANKLQFADKNPNFKYTVYYQFPTGIYKFHYTPGDLFKYTLRNFTRTDRGRPESKVYSWIPIEEFTPICLI